MTFEGQFSSAPSKAHLLCQFRRPLPMPQYHDIHPPTVYWSRQPAATRLFLDHHNICWRQTNRL